MYNYSGGTGTIEDPYIISTPQDLHEVRYNLDKHFKLNTDIDLNPAIIESEVWYNEIEGWEPIGNEAEPFTGSFDFNGKKILNMTQARYNFKINQSEQSAGFMVDETANFNNKRQIDFEWSIENDKFIDGDSSDDYDKILEDSKHLKENRIYKG